jgi:hypothetical protein
LQAWLKLRDVDHNWICRLSQDSLTCQLSHLALLYSQLVVYPFKPGCCTTLSLC